MMTAAPATGLLAQGAVVLPEHELRVLIVEDSTTDTNLILQVLRRIGRLVEFDRVEDEAAMRVALASRPWDLIVSDWSLPRFSGLGALAVAKQNDLEIPFIIVSGTIGEEMAVDAMRAGAHDYVLKDKLARLAPAVERELRDSESRRQRKRAEKTLAATEEGLREAQRIEAIGRLAGGVAHTLNDLLSIVLSYSAIALEHLTPDDVVRKDIEEIERAGERAASLTRQLLAFNRQQALQPRVLNLNLIVTELDQIVRGIVGQDIEYEVVTQPNLGMVKADPGQIKEVIMSLVTNARDAMPDGGSLTLEIANVELDQSDAQDSGAIPGPHVMLAIRDTGIGMDGAVRGRIFEPFFTTKDKGKGAGLGLSTALGIVKQSDGSICVSSELGKGTTFKVYLPRSDAAPSSMEQQETPIGIERGTETVLLVEDDSQLRALLRNVLVRNGYRVLDAGDAATARRLSAESQDVIHLLLTDVVMPRISGPELAEILTFVRPNLRVLYMSGYDHDGIVGRSVLESVAYLQKPITPAVLARKVREVLTTPIKPSIASRSSV